MRRSTTTVLLVLLLLLTTTGLTTASSPAAGSHAPRAQDNTTQPTDPQLPPGGIQQPMASGSGYAAAIQALVPGGVVISPYGVCRDGCARRHQGVDVGAARGTIIRAIEPGVISRNYWDSIGGWALIMRDDKGRKWYLAHMNRQSSLREGQRVSRGTTVGVVGTSGNAEGTTPHLHFQVTWPGSTDWADPARVLANWSSGVGTSSAPTPTARLSGGSQVSLSGGAAVATSVAWPATSGALRYVAQQSTNYGDYYTMSLPSSKSTSVVRWLRPGSNYQYRVSVQYSSGAWSRWTYGPRFTVGAYQAPSSAISYYRGTWRSENPSYSWGGVRYATAYGSRASFRFSGRSVSWVGTKGPGRGRAYIYVDGRYVKTVDLYASSTTYRRLVSVHSWSFSGTHTLEIRVPGTSGRPRVDLDAFVVLR